MCARILPWVFFTRGIRRALPHIPSVISKCRSVFLCVQTYQCRLCSAAVGLGESGWRVRWWWFLGDGWGSGGAGCLPCVYLGRVVPLKAPPLSVDGTEQGLIALYLSWEQNIPQWLYRGAEATPLTEWALCRALTGLTGLTWLGKVCSQMCHSLNDAFKACRRSAQRLGTKQQRGKVWAGLARELGKGFAGLLCVNALWEIADCWLLLFITGKTTMTVTKNSNM